MLELEAELHGRKASRANLVHYTQSIEVPGAPLTDEDDETIGVVETALAEHHILLLNKLQQITEKRNGRLMVFMPPGSAKSTYASVVFPSWFLGRDKNKKLILASYGDALSRKMGRRTRQIARQPRFNAVFTCGISHESAAADQWALTNGSEYLATGIMAGITGNRAHGIVIDDPVKGRAEAKSDAVSQSTWDAYNDDLKSRLIPGGFIVIVQTRWSQKDLSGRILPDEWDGESGLIRCKDGQDWEVICLPAKCESATDPLGRAVGEYLWPEWFDKNHWAEFEIRTETWASLYQQRPSPLEGGLFKPDQIKVIDAIPAESIKWIRGWDFASTTDGDYTAGGKLGRLPDGRFVIGDMVRLRRGPDERDAAIVNTASRDSAAVRISIPQDPGQAGKTQVLYLTRSLAGYSVTSSPETGDKVTRAEPLAAQVNVGNVLMLRGGWNEELINEMRMFPNGKHDDQIDALSRSMAEILGNSFDASMWAKLSK